MRRLKKRDFVVPGLLVVLSLVPTLGGVALYFLLHDWLARGRSERPGVGRSVAALGTLVVGVSLIEWATIADEPSLFIRNMFPFGHSNYTAGFIVLVFPWLVYAAWASRGPARAGWISAGLLSLFALATTSSRGGVLALLFMGVAATVVNGEFVASGVPLQEGTTQLVAHAVDSLGHAADSPARAVERDSQGPQVAITEPAPDALLISRTVTVCGTVGDPHLDRVVVGAVTATVSAGEWVAAGVALPEGESALVAHAEDTLGNASDSTAVPVVVDTIIRSSLPR